MRYPRGDNFLAYLCIRCMLLNIESVFNERHRRSNVEEEDMSSFLLSIYSCNCESYHLLSSRSGEGEHIGLTPHQYENMRSSIDILQPCEEGNPIVLKDVNLAATSNAHAREVAKQVLELLSGGAS